MKETCCIKECEKDAFALGMCRKHYVRAKCGEDVNREYRCNARHGLSNLERFNTWFDRPEEGCWLWKGGKNGSGYGTFTEAKEGRPGMRVKFIAHRKSYEIANGEIPFGMIVRHKCDNKMCVRPDHLELGTQADNARDNYERGLLRGIKGEENHNSKLNATSVHEIKVSKESVWELAKRYNVSSPLIYKIRAGKIWKHVT